MAESCQKVGRQERGAASAGRETVIYHVAVGVQDGVRASPRSGKGRYDRPLPHKHGECCGIIVAAAGRLIPVSVDVHRHTRCKVITLTCPATTSNFILADISRRICAEQCPSKLITVLNRKIIRRYILQINFLW